jgi:membrane dipeptidase
MFYAIAAPILLFFSCKSPEERLRIKAEKIHREVLTLDSHVDTPLLLFREEYNIGQRNDPYNRGGKIDFPRMEEGSLDAAFFAVFVGQAARTPEAYEVATNRALSLFDMIHTAIDNHPEQAALALTPDDAYALKKEGKRAIYIGVENGYTLGEDMGILQTFYDLGGRYLGLSHTRNNQLCDSSTDREGEEHGGLSAFGKDVVRELNRLGMMVDVSHISDQSFYDVLDITTAPIIASHSNAKAICDNPRNLDDDMLMALSENGGVIQLCILSSYVKDMERNLERDSAFADLRAKHNNFEGLSDEEMNFVRSEWGRIDELFPQNLATVADLVDHVDHIVNLIGIDYVGIGTDFDGGGGLEDCYDVTELGNITLELVRRGYSKKDIEKIWSGNFMRVFREVEKRAGKSS